MPGIKKMRNCLFTLVHPSTKHHASELTQIRSINGRMRITAYSILYLLDPFEDYRDRADVFVLGLNMGIPVR